MLPPFRATATALVLVMSFSAPSVVVQPNDNRTPAGQMRGDTLHLRMVVQMATWRPEKDDGPVIEVAAFAEEGEAPRVPAPLIRVREGTVLSVTVRNALTDSAITLIGLNTHPTKRDSATIRPGESRLLVFRSGAAGTYMYRARLGVGAVNVAESDQLAGAFIVDPPGGSAPDRVFVINIWGRGRDSVTYSNALTINGRSWPSTERLEAIVGDTLHWRVINATGRPHPMHLHGAYFRVDSKGNMFSDTTYATDQRRLAVTEVMRARTTMRMVWSPLHEGRWLFHCHLMFHVIPSSARVDTPPGTHEHSVDPMEHMAGLVLGIDARMPSGVKLAGRAKARQLDLYVQEGPQRARAKQSMSFILQQGRTPPRPDSVLLPGSLIVLTRDEPTDITVHNRMKHPTAVHWHGLELESFSDGVAGWGGSAQMPSPPVEAGGTFTARLTMPRAGTFIYHTHLRDGEQLTSGLYGPIVVMEPGKKFDARRDHVHIMGWDGLDKVQGLVNGDSTSSPPIEMRRGETHRFRFINIGAAESGDFTLKRDTVLAEWRPVAKDGADLIAAQRVIRPAAVSVDVGETYDFEFTPTVAGEYVLSVPNNSASKTWERKIFVRK